MWPGDLCIAAIDCKWRQRLTKTRLTWAAWIEQVPLQWEDPADPLKTLPSGVWRACVTPVGCEQPLSYQIQKLPQRAVWLLCGRLPVRQRNDGISAAWPKHLQQTLNGSSSNTSERQDRSRTVSSLTPPPPHALQQTAEPSHSTKQTERDIAALDARHTAGRWLHVIKM